METALGTQWLEQLLLFLLLLIVDREDAEIQLGGEDKESDEEDEELKNEEASLLNES